MRGVILSQETGLSLRKKNKTTNTKKPERLKEREEHTEEKEGR